jgi:hypothetical protein
VSRSTRSDAAQLRKLEYFFRDEVDGEDLGRRGDYDDLTPVDTAIRAMRELVAMINGDRKITRAELRAIGARLGHSAQRFRIDTRPEAKRLGDAVLADLGSRFRRVAKGQPSKRYAAKHMRLR